MGFATGNYLKLRHENSAKPIRIGWFPGPKGAGWVTVADKGFRDAMKNTSLRVIETKYGDPEKQIQEKLIAGVLKKHSDLDYIAGTAVSAVVATRLLRKMHLSGKTKVLSFYFGPGVYRGIKRGTIIGAPSDQPAIQVRIALNQIVRILEKRHFFKHVRPKIIIEDKKNIKSFKSNTSLAPRGFRPTFSVN